MSDWPCTPLAALCNPRRSITYGIVKVGDYVPGGVPVIRGGDIRNNRIVFNDEKRVSEDVNLQFHRTILTGGEILLNLIAEPGHSAIVPDSMAGFNVSRDVAVISLGRYVNHNYVNYYLRSPMAIEWLRTRLQGSVTLKINLSTLSEVPIPLPDRTTQEAITCVLGALDDKIAANGRLRWSIDQLAGSVLEQILGEDSTHTVVVRLADVARVNGQKVSPVPNGHLHYIDISSVSEGNVEWPERIPWANAPGRARRGIQPGDTIWSTVRPSRRSFALILENDPELVVSTGFAVLTPHSVGPAFLYEIVKRDEFVEYLESVAEGSAYPAVRAERFKQAKVPLPSRSRLDWFEAVAIDLRRRANSAQIESRTLAKLRDTLLPRLMSGEIRVRDAEKFVEDAT